MVLKLANNATSMLTANITSVATTLSVASVDADKYPILAAGDWFPLTIVDGAGNLEIVRATARAGAVITIVRAQDGTAARAFVAGSRVDLRLTTSALAGFALLDGDDKIPAAQTRDIIDQLAAAPIVGTPADGDQLVGVRTGGATKFRTTWLAIKATLKTYFDAIYATPANIATAVNGAMAGNAYPRRSDGTKITFSYAGQGGQPTWLWGTNDGVTMQVYNPASFNVLSVGGWTQAAISAQIEARAAAHAQAWAVQEANRVAGPGGPLQVWQGVSRNTGTWYLNNTGRPIVLAVVGGGPSIQIAASNDQGAPVQIGTSAAVIPNNQYYRHVSGSGYNTREYR